MMQPLRMCVLLALFASSAWAGDWPQFLGPNRNGVVHGQNLPAKFPAGGPRQVWNVDVGIGFGGPTIRDGRVYLLDREEDARDVLRCVALRDGKELWRTAYEVAGKLSYPGSRSSPTVDEKLIFTVGGFGHVHAFERQTGRIVWGFDLREKFKSPVPNWGFAQSPLLYKEWVIIAPMSAEAGLAAIKKETGEVVWKSEPVGGNTYASPRLYTIGGVEQVVFITNDRVVGIEPDTGRKLWQFDGYKNKIPIPSPTQIDDQRLFITGGYGTGSVMVRLDRSGDGFVITELWRTELGTQIHAAVFHDGYIYINSNENDNLKAGGKNAPGMVCLNLDGKVQWQTGNQPSIDRGGMIVADGRAYLLGGETGVLHLVQLSPNSYAELDSAKVVQAGRGNEHIWGPMALSNGYLVVRDQKQMKCFDLRLARQAKAN